MQQVRVCASADYELVNASSDQVNIVVKPKEPGEIASALAAAFRANEDKAEQIVVWAWSSF
ncbi:MAG: hypothetical protein M3P18_21515 [Actinomycetota bacterium]|nr:hypothetical protein [Actinomycetota bacterium]